MAARDLHPGEFVNVRVVQTDQAGGPIGYELCESTRTIGTRCVDIVEDFLSHEAIGGTSVIIVGRHVFNWSANAASVGGTAVGVDATERALGVCLLQTGTAGGNFSALSTDTTLQAGWSRLRCFWRVDVVALSTAGTEWNASVGFSDNFAAVNPTTTGVFFRYQRSVDGDFWVAVSYVGGVAQKTVTTVAPTPGVFQVLEVDINEKGTFASFHIDGVRVATHVRSFTGAQVKWGARCDREAAGVAARSMRIDFARLIMLDGAER